MDKSSHARRRRMGAVLAFVVMLVPGLCFGQAADQDYPNRTVRIVVAFGAGGGSDTMARVIASALSDKWQKQVIVENRPGADGTIGTEYVARQKPDGYTLLLQTTGHIIIPHLLLAQENVKVAYDPIADFTPIINIADSPFAVIVPAKLPIGSVKDLITQCKAKPGTCTWGSSDGSSFMAGNLFRSMAGLDMIAVRYKGTGQMATDLLGGHLMIGFSPPLATLPHVQAGTLKILGIGGSKRSSLLPDVPTIAEAGVPGYQVYAWYGLFAPAGTPAEIVNKVHRDVLQIIATPEMKKKLAELGTEIVGNTPAEFAAALSAESRNWERLAKESKK